MRWFAVVCGILFACSSQPAQDPPALTPTNLPMPPENKPKPAPATASSASTSAPADSKPAASNPGLPKPGEEHILSDLMQKRLKSNITPLLRGGEEGKAADQRMEELFLKIRASAPATPPDDWREAWTSITEEAIKGTPDARGVRPWNAACKKCHDTYRDTYKAKYHARIIPVSLD